MYIPAWSRASLTERAGREVSLGRQRGRLREPHSRASRLPRQCRGSCAERSHHANELPIEVPYWAMAQALNPSRGPIRRGWYLAGGFAVLVVMAGGFIGWQRLAQGPGTATVSAPPPAVPVTVATAEVRDVPVYLTGFGTVQ